jgi:K+-transporting ATPase ATPase C chain
MRALFSELRQAVAGTLVLAVVCCGLYPLLVWGIGQAVFRDRANGSLIRDSGGAIRGSALLGQSFTGAGYFHSRPSAAGAGGYDAAGSSGTNLGPTSQKLADAIKERITSYRTENGLKETDSVPADAVTASGSGLDPHISPRNAELQAARVADARGFAEEKVREIILANTEGPDLGVFGQPGVNVLKLNIALDALSSVPEFKSH